MKSPRFKLFTLNHSEDFSEINEVENGKVAHPNVETLESNTQSKESKAYD